VEDVVAVPLLVLEDTEFPYSAPIEFCDKDQLIACSSVPSASPVVRCRTSDQ
jgi:hypothetical protein